jgi:hypothetical protein
MTILKDPKKSKFKNMPFFAILVIATLLSFFFIIKGILAPSNKTEYNLSCIEEIITESPESPNKTWALDRIEIYKVASKGLSGYSHRKVFIELVCDLYTNNFPVESCEKTYNFNSCSK